jgi:transposase
MLPFWKHEQHNVNPSRKNRAMKTPPVPKPSQQNYVQTALRLPPDLHLELQDAAEKNGRSMNAEIVARLRGIPILEHLDKLSRDVAEIKALDRQILSIVGDR